MGKKTDQQLLALMRGKSANSFDYLELRAELERRVAIREMAVAAAQIRTAWLQFAAVIAMYVTLTITLMKHL